MADGWCRHVYASGVDEILKHIDMLKPRPSSRSSGNFSLFLVVKMFFLFFLWEGNHPMDPKGSDITANEFTVRTFHSHGAPTGAPAGAPADVPEEDVPVKTWSSPESG